jgi:hypothetical protein
MKTSLIHRIAPALVLVVAAPLIAEVLSGSTRLRALFVFPIEMCVWGGGALMIRAAVRHWRLRWPALVLLGIALAIAEESLIQQSSLAPLVIKLKGVEYARAFGLNVVYFVWALIYESVFVVVIPVCLVEMMFPQQRELPWLNRTGAIVTAILFLIGCGFAWFTWTRIARVNVFHQPPYTPPMTAVVLASAAIIVLIFAAFRLPRENPPARMSSPPQPWLLFVASTIWAVALYALVVIAFGIAPELPPAVAFGWGLALAAAALVVPIWSDRANWRGIHAWSVASGAVTGTMLASFVGFVQSIDADFWFKLVVNVLALIGLIALGERVSAYRIIAINDGRSE